LIRDFQSRLDFKEKYEVLNLFRTKPPTIPTHEARLVDLDRQISDTETDLQQAEAAAVDAALNATGLTAATDEVVRVTAALSALRAARTQIEGELATMRAKEAEVAFKKRSEAAEAVAVRIADDLAEIAHAVEPKLQRAHQLLKCADVAVGFFTSTNFVMPPLALLVTAGSELRAANFNDRDVVERIERLQKEAAVLQEAR
jgi:hypothetical protein